MSKNLKYIASVREKIEIAWIYREINKLRNILNEYFFWNKVKVRCFVIELVNWLAYLYQASCHTILDLMYTEKTRIDKQQANSST